MISARSAGSGRFTCVLRRRAGNDSCAGSPVGCYFISYRPLLNKKENEDKRCNEIYKHLSDDLSNCHVIAMKVKELC